MYRDQRAFGPIAGPGHSPGLLLSLLVSYQRPKMLTHKDGSTAVGMILYWARGRPTNPARDTNGLNCWKGQQFRPLVSGSPRELRAGKAAAAALEKLPGQASRQVGQPPPRLQSDRLEHHAHPPF